MIKYEHSQKNSDQLKKFFNNLLDFVFITDLKGNIVHVNQKVLDCMEFTLEELLGTSVLKLHPPDQQEKAKEILANMLEGRQETCHIGLCTKKGKFIPVDTKVILITWEGKKALLAFCRDLRDQKKTEYLLKRQNEQLQYRIHFEELLNSISSQFIDLPFHEINDHINDLLKKAGEFEKVDRSYIFLIDEELEEINNTHEWCAPGIEPQKDNLQHQAFDFTPWWMEKLYKLEEIVLNHIDDLPSNAQSERDILKKQSIQSLIVVPLSAGKKLIGFFGFDAVKEQRQWTSDTMLFIKTLGHIVSNAIKRLKMEQDLEKKELQNTALLNAVPDFIFRIKKDGTILEFKSVYKKILNQDNIIIGHKLMDYLDQAQADLILNSIHKALSSGEVQTLEYDAIIKDRRHTFEARINQFDEDEVIVVARDVCQRKRLEKIKSDFINRTAHDLRTPIATMNIMVELLNNHNFSDESKEYWEVLKKELDRQRVMVEKLLNIAQLENEESAMDMQIINIKTLLNEVLDSAKIFASSRNISIDYEECKQIKDAVINIFADQESIFQVFFNLVCNAVKFSHPNEKVSVMLATEGPDVVVTVADKGIGIPEEDQEFLFMSFFRASNVGEKEEHGSGLGLYIVKTVLDKHEGKIFVNSKVNKGTVFKVLLPKKEV